MSASAPSDAPPRDEDTLAHALRVLRRRWLAVVLPLLACVGIAIGYDQRQTPTYRATASVAFSSVNLPGAALQLDLSSGSPEREAATNVLVARSPEVAKAVREQLGTSRSAGELLDAVDVEAAPNADVLYISATSTDPPTAARVANAFADQYIAFQLRTKVAAIDAASRRLEAELAQLPAGSLERESLEQSVQRLAQLRAVANSGARVIGRAGVPDTPTGLGLKMMAALGALIGLAIGLTLAFILESIDRRITSIDEFERGYRARVLAGVPRTNFRRRRAIARRQQLEPYRILRSALDFTAVTSPLDCILVTSAVSDEGKTTVAIDLAHAIAIAGRPVVVVELDLRRPAFAEHFEQLDPSRGVTTALLNHDVPVRELLVRPIADLPELSVLPSGVLPPNPAELLGSQALTDLLAELGEGDTTVVIDAPPLVPVADTQELFGNPHVDGALIVARLRHTTREQVRHARSILDRHATQLLGLVVTNVREQPGYGYSARERQERGVELERARRGWRERLGRSRT